MLTTRLLLIVLVVALAGSSPSAETARQAEARLQADVDVLRAFRPAYPFWQHIFTIPDGRIAFGSAVDGRLLATFPSKGDWSAGAVWSEASLGTPLTGVQWPVKLDDRRDLAVARLEPSLGPLLHNPTRGQFLLPNIPRYGPFLGEWSLIYERFGVPADIGLAQAILESGLKGTARSKANALGLCQWLRRNWQTLDRLSPVTIEVYNQTTQASYCAAYLSILATMYGSFIPALSEHHSGGVNVGRALINGERLGGATPQEQYFKGSQFAHDLRAVDLTALSRPLPHLRGSFVPLRRDGVRQQGTRCTRIRAEIPQERIYAMRTRKALLDGRDHAPHEADRRRGPALQPGAHTLGARQLHAVPPRARGGVRRRRLVLAAAAERRLRLGARRIPAARVRRPTLARSVVRAGTAGLPEALRGDRLRGRRA